MAKLIIHPEEYRNFGHSRAKAIRAQCLECCGDSFAEVRNCTAIGCALWAFRLGYEVDKDGNKRIVIKNPQRRAVFSAESDSFDEDEEECDYDLDASESEK